jgi:TetR/AcrR family transcriptional regulator, regulator of cefoperazone and chloramphenicol sensitivity
MPDTVTVRFEDLSASARIRETALRLFAENGPSRTSLRMVADAAGVSLGAVMHHFRSKEGLERAVGDLVLDRLRAASALDAPSATLEGNALTVHEAFHVWLAENPLVAEYARRLQIEGSPSGQDFFREGHETARAYLRACVKAGVARPFRDEEVGVLLYVLLVGAPMWFRPMIEAVLDSNLSDPDTRRRFNEGILDILTDPLFLDRAAQSAHTKPSRPGRSPRPA